MKAVYLDEFAVVPPGVSSVPILTCKPHSVSPEEIKALLEAEDGQIVPSINPEAIQIFIPPRFDWMRGYGEGI